MSKITEIAGTFVLQAEPWDEQGKTMSLRSSATFRALLNKMEQNGSMSWDTGTIFLHRSTCRGISGEETQQIKAKR